MGRQTQTCGKYRVLLSTGAMRQQPPLGGNREYAQYRSVTMIRTFGGWGTTLTGRLVARPIYELRDDGERGEKLDPGITCHRPNVGDGTEGGAIRPENSQQEERRDQTDWVVNPPLRPIGMRGAMRTRRWVVGAVLTAFIVAVCGSVEGVDPAPESTSSTSTGSTSIETTKPDSLPSVETLDTGLPRTGFYAFLEVTVEQATIANIVPRTFLRAEQEVDTQSHIFLELSIRNTSETDVANWPPNPFALQAGKSITDGPQVLQGLSHIGLTSLNTTEIVLAFPVAEGQTFEDLDLILAQPDRIPMVLPLTAEVPQYAYPVDLGLDGDGPIVGGCGQDVDITVLEGKSLIDLIDSPYPTVYGSRRANRGERFLTVGVQILNNGGQRCGGGSTNFGTNSIRLMVDGLPHAPVAGSNISIPPDAVEEMEFHFAYPVAVQDLVVVVGSTDGKDLEFPVDTSPAPSLAADG